MKYKNLAINNAKDLVFGKAPNPVVTKRGLVFGGGTVYPELNFTLPMIDVSISNLENIKKHYRQIANDALQRAVELNSKGVVLEFETVIEMTKYPMIGIEIVKVLNDICEEFFIKNELKSEIRLTPNDLREFDHPPRLRTSKYLEQMFELFEKGAQAGGNLLSIESTGGKEISDSALMECNIKQFIFSQSILGVRDVGFIWERIVEIANGCNVLPGGDTACGFGNTAMVLAERKYIPKVFAAIARIATIVRTLVAIEKGAKGPDKDCGYEGPFLKAITGIPISMEGKTSACAHFSPLGNVAACCADLWSNESVQNIKLLSGMAPTVYMEQLEYDVRLMNKAIEKGDESVANLVNLFAESDIHYDPQALILAPENVIKISQEIVKGKNYLDASLRGITKSLEIIEEAYRSNQLILDSMEIPWIEIIKNDIQHIPSDESEFLDMILPTINREKILLDEYGL